MPLPQFIPSALTTTLKGAEGVLNLRCSSTKLPTFSVDMAKITVNGKVTQQPILATLEPSIELAFLEDDRHMLFRFFEYWKMLGSSPKVHTIVPRIFCMLPRGCFMSLLDIEGNQSLIYELWGVFPSKVTLGDLTGEATMQKLAVTLNYQNYEVR